METTEDQVYHTLRDAIRSRAYPPGCHLSESRLAEKLRVSRSPIREALKRLKGDGLVETIPNKGCFVKVFSAQETLEMLEARAMFECYAVRRLHGPLEKSQQERFYRFREQFGAALSNQQLYLLIDRAFHAEIVSLTQNEYIQKLYDDLNWQINFVDSEDDSEVTRQYLATLHKSHLSILDGLLNGRLEELPSLLEAHFLLAREIYQRNLAQAGPYQYRYQKTAPAASPDGTALPRPTR